MGLLDDAYFEHEMTFRIIEITGSAVALSLQLMIGCFAIYKMNVHSMATVMQIKLLFVFSFLLACFHSICDSIEHVYAISHGTTPDVLYLCTVSSGALFYLSMLAHLVIRLHVTYGESVYRMTTRTICVFSTIFILLLLSVLCVVLAWIIILNYNEDTGWLMLNIAGLSFLVFFIIGSVLAVRNFVGTLSKLAKSHGTFNGNCNGDKIALNKVQQKMVNLSGKYVLLFGLAILSTIISFGFAFIVSNEIGGTFYSFDFALNLYLSVLQFSFASEHYRRFCGCVDVKMRSAAESRIKMAIHEDSVRLPSPRKPNLDGADSVTVTEAEVGI